MNQLDLGLGEDQKKYCSQSVVHGPASVLSKNHLEMRTSGPTQTSESELVFSKDL